MEVEDNTQSKCGLWIFNPKCFKLWVLAILSILVFTVALTQIMRGDDENLPIYVSMISYILGIWTPLGTNPFQPNLNTNKPQVELEKKVEL